MASLYNIHLRTGCFCNTGACQQFLNLTNEQIKKNLSAGHVCGDDVDLIAGKPTGSVRISFGYMSSFADAKTFLNFLHECFLERVLNVVSQNTGATPDKDLHGVDKGTTNPVPMNCYQGTCTKDSGDVKNHSVVEICNDLPKMLHKPSELVHSHKNSALGHNSNGSNLEQDLSVGSLLNSKNPLPSCKTRVFEDYKADTSLKSDLILEKICLYPIKSCAAFEVIINFCRSAQTGAMTGTHCRD